MNNIKNSFKYIYTSIVYIVIIFSIFYIFRNCSVITDINKQSEDSLIKVNSNNIDTFSYKLKEIKEIEEIKENK